MRRLRIGLIGAARIAPHGIVDPCRAEPRAALVAVAARDRARADEFAATHRIGKAYESYETLIADPEIDLIYVATPPAFHAELALAALRAKKHVLVEKPFTLTAEEAREVLGGARQAGRRVFEAMHAIHHPLMRRLVDLVDSGAVGRVRHIASHFNVAITNRADFRWDGALGGGALMDLGVYPLAFLRRIAGPDWRVERAAAEWIGNADARIEADLRTADGVTGRIAASMLDDFAAMLTVEGEGGHIVVTNPVVPHRGHRLRWARGGETQDIEFADAPTSWTAQLAAICDTLIDAKAFPLAEDDFVGSMDLIARIRAAALPLKTGDLR